MLSDSRFVLSSVLIDSVSTSDLSSEAIDCKSNHGLGEDATVLGDGAVICFVIDPGEDGEGGEGKGFDVADIDLCDVGIFGAT